MATLLLMRYVAWVQYVLFGENGIFDIDKKMLPEDTNAENEHDDNEAYFSDSMSTDDPISPPMSPELSGLLPPTDPRTPPPPQDTPPTNATVKRVRRKRVRKVGPNPIPTATEVALRARARARAMTTAMLAAGAASFGYSRRKREHQRDVSSPRLRSTQTQQSPAPNSALAIAAMTSSRNTMGYHHRNTTGSDSLRMNGRRTSFSLSESGSRRGSLASLIGGGGDFGYVSMRGAADDDRESSVTSTGTDISLAAQFIDESYSNTPVHIGHMQYEKWSDLFSDDFAGSPSDIFHEAFSDDFIREIHAERESKELEIGEWEADDDDMIISNQPTTWKRKLEFLSKIKDAPSFLPTATKVKEVQRFRFYGSSKLVYDVAISTPNVKFMAHVQTLQRNTFTQDENDPNRSRMESTIAFKWPKKSLLKKFIISHAKTEAKRSMQVWGAKMHERLEILQKEKARESLSTNSTE